MSAEQTVTDQNPEPEVSGEVTQNESTEEIPPLWDRSVLLTPEHGDFLKMQTVPIGDDPAVRRSPRLRDENHLFGTLKKGVYTIHDMFIAGYDINHDAQCIGWRPSSTEPYKWMTYQEVYDMTRKVGSGLIQKGAQTNQNQFIGIYGKNSVPWFVLDRACAAYSMVSVPLYDSLGPEALTHIVAQCELTIILVDTNANATKLLNDAKEGKTNTIKLMILVEDESDDVKKLREEMSVDAVTFQELQELGEKSLQEFVPPKADDMYTIFYTSGTTGTPKGVMHKHKSGVAVASAYTVNVEDYFCALTPDDVLLSYLPLAHVLERYFECGMIVHGGKIGFYSGDPKKLLDDAAALKPTVFPMVPRVLNRIYAKINSAVGPSGIKRKLFDFCLARKMASLKKGVVVNDSFWDKLLFHKFSAAVGGRVKFCLSSAAPISPAVLNLVRCVLGIPIIEGYGQTESTSGFAVTLHGDFTGGNVGTLLPNTIAKLIDVPEKEYFAKDGKGEVCFKGLSVGMGYYKDEEKTKEAMTEDGWWRTGDIGEWLPNGSLKIIDRRKNIFKLSQGEYIAPEKIEQIYQLCGIVGQVYVHGHSLKSSLIAIVVPAEENIVGWCKENAIKVDGKTFAEICELEEVSKCILEEINKKGRAQGLKSFELVRKIHISSELFTIENELLTPTLKSRRVRIEKRYQSKIDEMYAGMD